MEHKKLNSFSHLTAIERNKPSFPLRQLIKQKALRGKILDFGCGFGKDVDFLLQKGFDAQGFDPYYFPLTPSGKFDTILCFYVLNVLFPEEQNQVLMQISSLLKPTGKAYFAVRRDIHTDGFRTHQLHAKPTYQCYVKLPYTSIFLNENTEFYEYQHFNQITHNHSKCPFCTPAPKLQLLAETPLSYSFSDGYPVTKGHTLIIPKRHVADYFELTFEEQKDLVQLASFTQKSLKVDFQPDGFNVGMNIGKSAGQKFPHTALHLIPRYEGDSKNPNSGIRNVLN